MLIMVTVVCIYNHKIILIMILSNMFHNDPCKTSANTLSLQDGVQLCCVMVIMILMLM